MPPSEDDQPKLDPKAEQAIHASEYKPTQMFTVNTEYKPAQPFISAAPAPAPTPALPPEPPAPESFVQEPPSDE